MNIEGGRKEPKLIVLSCMYCLSCSIFREIVPRSYPQTRARSSPYCKNSTSSIFVPRGRYVYFVIEIPVPHILCRHHTAPAPHCSDFLQNWGLKFCIKENEYF